MYKFALRITKNKKLATLASIIYILAPYRITDMYIRTALSELASFIFIPIVFEGLYIIVNEEKKSYKLALGATGLILTHQVIAMYTAIICFIYLIVFFKKLKSKTVLKNIGVNLLFCILMTSFYWVGLLQHYLNTSYEVFVPGRMEREEVLIFYKAKFSQLFITNSEQTMIYAIGLLSVIGLVLTPIAYKKIPKEYKKTYMFFLITGVILIGMTLSIFPFERLPQALTMLQFTFRLFTFTSFFFAFVVATNFAILIKNFKTFDVVVLLTISVLLLLPYKSKLDFNLQENEEKLINGVRVTENTGRVHAGMASMEYLPTKAFKNLKNIANRKDEVIVLDNDEAVISDYTKQDSNMNCKILNVKKETTIELPYIYYLGYRVYANGQEIKYTESDNGLIQINIAQDSQIKVKYLEKSNEYDVIGLATPDATPFRNNWTGATLNTELNTTYLNSLDSTSKSMIGNTKYYLGGKSLTYNNGYADTPLQFYSYERKIQNTTSNEFYNGTNPNSWVGKLGLMYVSDYGYASSNCENKKIWDNNSSSNDIRACNTTNWLFKGNSEWTLPQGASISFSAFYVFSGGYVSDLSVSLGQFDARPVLYLISSVQITGGNGTSSSPYTLGL